MQANDYDTFGQAYSTENETSLLNNYYERPAMVALAGDVRGHRVLDAGCGSGPLAARLQAGGATLTGFDASPTMVALARGRLGAGADLHVADLAEPLPFPDAAFDDVVASLVLHYLREWSAPLCELHRVLRPGGRLIASVHHPIMHKMLHPEADYFAEVQWSEEYTFAGQQGVLSYWHKPLHAMVEAFTDAGYAITTISEPPYDPDTPPDLVPERFKDRKAFISFIFFVLTAR